jgi:hypothetical protein
MTENTIDTYMPRQATKPDALVVSEQTSRLKLYEVDLEAAGDLQTEAQPIFRQLTQQEIIREAVHAGMPHVVRRYKAAVAAAATADKK